MDNPNSRKKSILVVSDASSASVPAIQKPAVPVKGEPPYCARWRANAKTVWNKNKARGTAEGNSPKQSRVASTSTPKGGALLVNPKAQPSMTSSKAGPYGSKIDSPSPFASWQTVERKAGRPKFGKPRPVDPGTVLNIEYGNAEKKKPKKNKSQRRRARLEREASGANSVTSSGEDAPKQSASAHNPRKKKNQKQRSAARRRQVELTATDNAAGNGASSHSEDHDPITIPSEQTSAGRQPKGNFEITLMLPNGPSTSAATRTVVVPTKRTGAGEQPKGEAGATQVPPDGNSAGTAAGSNKGPSKQKRAGKNARAAAKRAQQDETIPPQVECKKQRLEGSRHQSGTYSQVVKSGDAVIITDEHTTRITKEYSNTILRDVHAALMEMPRTMPTGTKAPGFAGKPIYAVGQLKLFPQDDYSADWLRGCIAGLSTPPGIKLVVARQSELGTRVHCGLFVPCPEETTAWKKVTDVAEGLSFQNEWAQVNRWSITNVEKQAGGWFLTFSVPDDLVPGIIAQKRALNCGLGQVYVKFRGPAGKFSEHPPQLGKKGNIQGLRTTTASATTNDDKGLAQEGIARDTETAGSSSQTVPTSEEDAPTGDIPTGAFSDGEEPSGRMETGLFLSGSEGESSNHNALLSDSN